MLTFETSVRSLFNLITLPVFAARELEPVLVSCLITSDHLGNKERQTSKYVFLYSPKNQSTLVSLSKHISMGLSKLLVSEYY